VSGFGCVECWRITQASFKSRQPNKNKEYKTRYLAKPETKAKILDYSKEYKSRPAVAAKHREKMRASYAADPAKVIAQVTRWQKDNMGYVRAIRKARKQRVRAGGTLTHKNILDKLELQKSKCAICKISVKKKYHVDHIIPVAAGGPNTSNNIQILCPTCNMSKGAKDPIDFMQSRGMLL
jgi:5-methylcytosine-specific restriction endonuclease McrA